jgi:hydroxymethylglutaryl-CoA lyase
MNLPESVRAVEVGLRGRLQNERRIVALDAKVGLVEALVDAGVKHVEVGNCVSRRLVPQMRDTADLLPRLRPVPDVVYSVQVPHRRWRDIWRGVRSIFHEKTLIVRSRKV